MSKVFCSNPECFFYSNPLPPETKECILCKSPVKVEQTLEDSNQGKPGKLQIKWCKEAFDSFPCVLAHEYKRLYRFYEDKNLYGLFMQLKDCLEVTVKYCVLSVFACGHGKNIPGKEIYEKKLPDELVFGKWYEMLRDIVNLQDHSGIPDSLFEFAGQVFGWVKSKSMDLVNWRNEYVGHGALAFEDDPAFIESVYSVIQYLSDFYINNYDLICKIMIRDNDELYVGYQYARNLPKEEDDCFLEVDGAKVPFEPFIRHIQNGIFFYDSLLRAKQSKLLCYPTGHSKKKVDSDILSLREQRTDVGKVREQTIESGTMTLQQYDAQARLSINERYVKPVALIKWLDDGKDGIVHQYSKGVFLLEMERGCGKTYFAEKLNGRFGGAQKLFNGTIDVRTVHMVKSQVGGVSRFLKDLATEWKLAEEYGDIIIEAPDMPAPEDDLSCNAKALADFLNDWRNRSAEVRGKEKIMLVLDGLDEIVESNSIIWSYIPSEELLEDGVYILLTSRCATEDLPALTKTRISEIKNQTRSGICVLADSKENKETLKAFVQSRIDGANKELIEKIISAAEYRLLYTAMLCELVKKNGKQIDLEGKKEITLFYLKSLEQYYGESRSVLYKNLLAMLLAVGKGESLSLSEIADLLQMGVIRFELLDMLQDLAPLMTIERGYEWQEEKIGDANRYHFANEEVASAVLEYLGKEYVISVLSEFMDDLRVELDVDGNNQVYTDGVYAYLAQMHVFIRDFEGVKEWQPTDIKRILNYIDHFPDVDDSKKQLNLNRHDNAEISIYEICRRLTIEQLHEVEEEYYAVSHKVSDRMESELLYEQALEVMEYERYVRQQSDDPEVQSGIIVLLYSMADLHYMRRENQRALELLEELELKLGDSKESIQNRLLYVKALVMKVKILSAFPGDPRRKHLIEYLDEAESNIRGLKKRDIDILEVEMEARYLHALIERDMFFKDDLCVDTFEYNIKQARRSMKSNPVVAKPWLANNLNSLGGYYKKKGDATGAIRYYRESVSLREEAFGLYEELYAEQENKHANDFGLLCNTTGNVLRSMHRFDESEKYHLKGIEIREKLAKRDRKAFGMHLATSYKNYGHLLGDMGNCEKAEHYLLKAIGMYEKGENLTSYDVDSHRAAYYNLMDAYLDACQRKKAIKCFEKIVEFDSGNALENIWGFVKIPNETCFPPFITEMVDLKYDDNKGKEYYVEEREKLEKSFEACRNSEQRIRIQEQICWYFYAVYMKEKSRANLHNCINAALHIMREMEEKRKKRLFSKVIGESLGFLLFEDAEHPEEGPDDLLWIAQAYLYVHAALFMNSVYRNISVEIGIFALSAYRELLLKKPECLDDIAFDYCQLNNNLGVLLYEGNKVYKALDLLENARSIAFRMMKEDESFALNYAATVGHELRYLESEKMEDIDRAVSVAKEAYTNLAKINEITYELADQIIIVCMFLLKFDKTADGLREKKNIYNKAVEMLDLSVRIPDSQKQMYKKLLRQFV